MAAQPSPPLSKTIFNLVLMDVQMPELDGFETTAAIRAKEELTGAHIPIIAMTAHALKGDQERCVAAGMDGYLSKPIRVEELLAIIEDQLRPKPALASPAVTPLTEPTQTEKRPVEYCTRPAFVFDGLSSGSAYC
jgi:CheY-like chemotaxis protein